MRNAAVYYNEFHPPAAEWLRNNIAAGLIAPGEVDTRSIKEVDPDDLKGFVQCHFFAGIGGWSYAARLAGWPDDRPLWSGSCPCQPFSAAGNQNGTDDPRHLWPDLYRLARSRRPIALVGEQVAQKAGYGWFDGVRADLERENYACRAVDVPALAIDAPHERNRLYWVALADAEGIECGTRLRQDGAIRDGDQPANSDGVDTVVNAPRERRGEGLDQLRVLGRGRAASGADGEDALGVTQGDAKCSGLEGQRGHGDGGTGWAQQDRSASTPNGGGDLADDHQPIVRPIAPAGHLSHEGADEGADEGAYDRGAAGQLRNGSWWAGSDWILCHDGKIRRVADSSSPLLVNGVRGGVPILRPASIRDQGVEGRAALQEEVRYVSRIAAWSGFGNAIVPPLAAEVIAALADTIAAGDWR